MNIKTMILSNNIMEELINDIIGTYKNPLIWKFNSIDGNRKSMYGEYDELKETFFVFYKNDDEYFIDIGCCYEYGDDDYGRFDFFGYGFEITRQIKLKTNIYENLLKELNLIAYIFGSCIDDYEIMNEDGWIEDYESIKKDDKVIWYAMNKDVFFIDNNEKIKYINAFIATL